MAPIRRYLRITKYSVLECRIYLDNPSLANSWLLNPRNPILPRVIESIRPLVIPKLREERERSRRKGGSKKKAIKDTVIQDDFEVAIFLTETNTRHSLLSKHKMFREKGTGNLQSNSNRLISETSGEAVDVDDPATVPVLREEDDDDVGLADIPTLGETSSRQRPKRSRRAEEEDGLFVEEGGSGDDEPDAAIEIVSDEDAPPSKRRRNRSTGGEDDDKKKLDMDVSYEGFAIYGRVLCLVIKKREGSGPANAGKAARPRAKGQAMMENWISSTQMPVYEDEA